MRYLLLFFCLVLRFLEGDISVTENHPETIVDCVSVITGDLYLQEEDVIVKGVEPIRLQRSYISNKGEGFWQFHLYHQAVVSDHANRIDLMQPNGTKLTYTRTDYEGVYTPFRLEEVDGQDLKGWTNTASGKLSAKTNLKNQRIVIADDDKTFVVFASDGTKRKYHIYERKVRGFFKKAKRALKWVFDNPEQKRKAALPKTYRLIKEELLNGNKIIYDWPDEDEDVWEIRSTSHYEDVTYAWIRFYPHMGRGNTGRNNYGVETSDGRHFEYRFFEYDSGETEGYQLKEVESSESGHQRIHYAHYKDKRLVSSITRPGNRSFHISYYIRGDRYRGVPLVKNDSVCLRVKEISVPSKEDGGLTLSHRFIYDVPNKRTRVEDSYGSARVYHWNDDLHLTKIDYFTKEGSFHSRVKFVFGKPKTKDAYNLIYKIFFDSDKKPVKAVHYFYDTWGNVVEEKVLGDLTGRGFSFSLDSEGIPIEEGVEKYSTHYMYSQDGAGLLLRQEEDSGLRVDFSYFKKTPLVAEASYYDLGVLKKKDTYKYNGRNILFQKVVEDVSAGTRLVTSIGHRTDRAPYPGMPSSIEEWAGPDSNRLFLGRTLLHYSPEGHVSEKEIYDGSNALRYKMSYSYLKGRLVLESNAMGQVATYKYDELGNRIEVAGFDGKTTVEVTYDLMNRPVFFKEKGAHLQRGYSYRYDYKGYKIAEVDEYKKETQYEYDSFGNVVATCFPNGGKVSVSYNSLGFPISCIDAGGFAVYTTYNIRGQPTRIIYPDGGEEFFQYYPNGTLESHVDQAGLKTTYTYDAFDRVLTKETPYALEQFVYDGFNLVSQIDPEGIITSYYYDAAGRKICEESGEERTFYEYDALGRLHKTVQGALTLQTEYDLLNRIEEEKKIDEFARILEKVVYGYDSAGNRVSITKEINGNKSTDWTHYDEFNRASSHIDPLGHKTDISYGVAVNSKTIIDPMGFRVEEIFLPNGKVAKIEKYSAPGHLLCQEEYQYDLRYNLTSKKVTLSDRATTNCWSYDCMNRIESFTEDTKTTYYTYNTAGQLVNTRKPNGVDITLVYNDRRQVISEFSSDGSICYSYEHDCFGNVLLAVDENSHESVLRAYDPRGRLFKETLPVGVSTTRKYDCQGRKTELAFSDGSSIVYDYSALYLQKVSRYNSRGVFSYYHEYVDRDHSGNILLQKLPFGVGEIRKTHDLLGRAVFLDSPYFTQKHLEFDAVGNLKEMEYREEERSYRYDETYQLKKENKHTYTHDALYNRIKADHQSYQINALNQTSALEYDASGNPPRYQGKALKYDALDRLILVEDGSKRVAYTYDAFHRRLSKKVYRMERDWVLDSVMYFVYDEQNEIGAVDSSGKFIELRVLGSTNYAEIGAAIAFELYDKIYIPFCDLQGNIAAILDVEKASIKYFTYTAFGVPTSAPSSPHPWRFSSKRVDPETGFIYYGRRYYMPELGRWLTQDPLGLTAGPNVYAFLKNNTLSSLDLYGLAPQPVYDFGTGDIYTPPDAGFMANAFSQPPPQYYSAGSQEFSGQIGFVNGMNTTSYEAYQYSSMVSEFAGGIKTNNVYNTTNGAFFDVGRCMAETSLRYEPPSVRLIRDSIVKFDFENILSRDKKMFWVVHSEGALQMYNALKGLRNEFQQRCIVLAIAPAKVVPERLCFKSFNYVSTRDFVPYSTVVAGFINHFFSPGNIQNVKDLRELIILKPHHDASFHDHSFNSPTFKDVIKRDLGKYLDAGIWGKM